MHIFMESVKLDYCFKQKKQKSFVSYTKNMLLMDHKEICINVLFFTFYSVFLLSFVTWSSFNQYINRMWIL